MSIGALVQMFEIGAFYISKSLPEQIFFNIVNKESEFQIH